MHATNSMYCNIGNQSTTTTSVNWQHKLNKLICRVYGHFFEQFSQQAEVAPDLSKLAPPNSIRLQQDATISTEAAYAQGEKLLRDGRVGVVIVAGGQGSRLGFPHPKGLFPIGPLSERTLFQFVLDKIAGYSEIQNSNPFVCNDESDGTRGNCLLL